MAAARRIWQRFDCNCVKPTRIAALRPPAQPSSSNRPNRCYTEPVIESKPTLAQTARSHALRGILLMCLGVCMFPFLNTAAKLLTADYPITEIVWARFTGHLVCVLLVFMPKRGWRIFAASRPFVQIARSFLLLPSTTLFVSPIGHLPPPPPSPIAFPPPFLSPPL